MDERETFEYMTEALRVTRMRLANAREDGNGDLAREYEEELAGRREDRLIALGDWMGAEGGKLPPQEIRPAPGNVDGLTDDLHRNGGNITFTEWVDSPGESESVLVHFPQDDVPGTLACLDALTQWRQAQ